MNKKILLTMLALITTTTFANVSVSIGGVVGKQSGLYRGSEDTKYLPYINAKYENFYIRGFEIGYKFLDTDILDLTAYSNLQDGHSIKGSNMEYGYRTINSRKKQITGGLRLEAPLNVLEETINLTTTLEGGRRGIHGGLKLSKPFYLANNFIIAPNVNSKYFSKDYTRYYFGTTNEEIGGAIEKAYKPDNAYSIGVGLYAEYYFNKAFSIFGNIDIDKYSNEVRKSPIIKNQAVTNISVGAKYSF